jgi:hypothetical protein
VYCATERRCQLAYVALCIRRRGCERRAQCTNLRLCAVKVLYYQKVEAKENVSIVLFNTLHVSENYLVTAGHSPLLNGRGSYEGQYVSVKDNAQRTYTNMQKLTLTHTHSHTHTAQTHTHTHTHTHTYIHTHISLARAHHAHTHTHTHTYTQTATWYKI